MFLLQRGTGKSSSNLSVSSKYQLGSSASFACCLPQKFGKREGKKKRQQITTFGQSWA